MEKGVKEAFWLFSSHVLVYFFHLPQYLLQQVFVKRVQQMLIVILAIVGSLKLTLKTNVVYPLMRQKLYATVALAPALEIVAAVDVLLRLQLMGL